MQVAVELDDNAISEDVRKKTMRTLLIFLFWKLLAIIQKETSRFVV